MGVGDDQRIDIPDVLAWIEGFIPDDASCDLP